MRSTGSSSKGGLAKTKTLRGESIVTRVTLGLKTKIFRQDDTVNVKESKTIRSAVAAFAVSTIGQASEIGSLLLTEIVSM